jgi:hypothetical protein
MSHITGSSLILRINLFIVLTLLLSSLGRRCLAFPHQANVVENKVPAAVEPFDPSEVQLLDGPFKQAQDLNHRLLLKTDLNVLLYPYRREAGIPSPVKGRDDLRYPSTGHTLGHFLSACALIYGNTGDAEIKAKADEAVKELAECQKKLGNGYIGGMPEKSVLELEGVVQDPKFHADVPWYCLHKLYAGLLDMYLLTGNVQALDILKKAADWAENNTSRLSDAEMENMLRTEQGGIKEVFLNLYGATGDIRYLKLGERFTHHAVLDPFLHGKDPLDGLHANTQIPKFIGLSREYELTGNPSLNGAVVSFWNSVTAKRSYVTGGNSSKEHFTPQARLSTGLTDTSESCNEYNMLRLTRHLFCLQPKPAYADYFERTLYNHVLSSRNPINGNQLYFQQMQSGSSKELWKSNPVIGGEVCCHGSGLESNAKYEESIYFHDGTRKLYVNLFLASVLDWKSLGLKLTQKTSFPDTASSEFIFESEHPVALTLMLRRPWWSETGFRVTINGARQNVTVPPGSYLPLKRSWNSGDVVKIEMPMSFRFEGFRDKPDLVAVMYGPLVMAAVTKPKNPCSEIHPPKELDPLGTLKPIKGETLAFTAPSDVFVTTPYAIPGNEVLFKPLFRLIDESYAVYWDLVNGKVSKR